MKFTKNCTQSVEGEAGREPVWEAVEGFLALAGGKGDKEGLGEGTGPAAFLTHRVKVSVLKTPDNDEKRGH